jgi:hypothetical protein
MPLIQIPDFTGAAVVILARSNVSEKIPHCLPDLFLFV